MHATVQPGGRSPKAMSGPTSTSQLKPGSDSVQSSSSSFPSQGKGKKRERADQSSVSAKREHSSKVDYGDTGHGRLESALKSEISKITEKGGLVDFECVEKLVQLMLPEKKEKKVDLVSRSILAGVIAATDKFDCLSRFVQLRGLPVFDEWLKEVHKGKVGDSSSPKDSDKLIDEFLLVLLRALDKLPVNLHALQMCNIGKSVNHLRSHKNLEIQRKARSLVDTWKKRVEAEMDTRKLPEVSHGVNRHMDLAMKTSGTHSHASKSSVKLVQGENTTKSSSPSPGSTKSPQSFAVSRDDKSRSSSPSHNSCQSYLGDHAKTGGIQGKDDTKSFNVASGNVNKSPSDSSRNRETVNGYQGSAPYAVHEIGSSKSPSWQRNVASGIPAAEGNGPRIIVKISTRARSPVQNITFGSFEKVVVTNSRASSTDLSEKSDQVDCHLREKNDTDQADINSYENESRQSSDSKVVLIGSNKGSNSASAIAEKEGCRAVDDSRKIAEVSKDPSIPSTCEPKSAASHDASLSSINALIESCVHHSEMNATDSVGDDMGMNLLASAAAGDIFKSDAISPSGSSQAINNAGEDVILKSFLVDDVPKSKSSSSSNRDDGKEHGVSGISCSKDTDSQNMCKPVANHARNLDPSAEDLNNPVADQTRNLDSSAEDLKQEVNQCLENRLATMPSPRDMEMMEDDVGSKELKGVKVGHVPDANHVLDVKQTVGGSSLLIEAKVIDLGVKVEKEAIESHSSDFESDGKNEQKPPTAIVTSEVIRGTKEVATFDCGSFKNMDIGNDDLKSVKADELDASSHCDHTERQKDDEAEGISLATVNQVVTGIDSFVIDRNIELAVDTLDVKENNKQTSDGATCPKASSISVMKEKEHQGIPKESRLKRLKDSTTLVGDPSSVSAEGGIDTEVKVEFDLNEGFSGIEGRNEELNNVIGPGSLSVQLVSPVPFLTPIASALPASITVAAATKGLFVPPKDLLRNRSIDGWKGSAARSAFRPAEPRKILEVPVGPHATASDSTTGREARAPLDIDLNIPDGGSFEDLASLSSDQVSSRAFDLAQSNDVASTPIHASSALDLDLNRGNEQHIDMGNHAGKSYKLELSLQPVKPSSSSHISDNWGGQRDFDLNNGPTGDEMNLEPSIFLGQNARNGMPSQLPLSGVQVNCADVRNISSLFPADAYSAVSVPSSSLSKRGEHSFPIVLSGDPQRMLCQTTNASPFTADLYRGPVLSSSPAFHFQSTTPFQYPVFPFSTSFPVPSATFSSSSATHVDSSSSGRLCFPPADTQLFGPAVAVPSHYPPHYAVSLTDGSNSVGSDSGRKWYRPDLDLNTGPGGTETNGRIDPSFLVHRPLSASSSQSLTEEHSRVFQMSGGLIKRKEPEGGWDSYKHSSRQ